MNIYENLATEILVSIFKTSAYWKKEIVFNFLLKPFNKNIEDIKDVTSQETLKDTKPDFTIHLKDKIEETKKEIHFEVKINNAELTTSEKKKNSRDAFLILSDYIYREKIPSDNFILTWEEFFDEIDKKEAMPCFEELSLLRNCLFGTNKDLDMGFLTQFLYSKEYVKSELKDIFKKLFDLIKKDEQTKPNETERDCEISLNNYRQSISLGYEFGEDNHVGHFYISLNKKTEYLQLKETTEFIKPYDKVWYFYKHIEPFIKENTLTKTEKEILNSFLDKASKLSPKSYLQICQTILEKELYPKLYKYAKQKLLKFEYDDLADIEKNHYPKLYFHKESWYGYFFITFEFDVSKFVKKNKSIKFYYGIWAGKGWRNSKEKLYTKLQTLCKRNNWQSNDYFPKQSKKQTISSVFFKNFYDRPNILLDEIKNTITEILPALNDVEI